MMQALNETVASTGKSTEKQSGRRLNRKLNRPKLKPPATHPLQHPDRHFWLTTLSSATSTLRRIAAFLWSYDRAMAVIMAAWYLLILSVVFSGVRGVFTVALYRYATQREAPAGFSADLIDEALGGR